MTPLTIELYRALNYKEFIGLFHEVNGFFKLKGKQLKGKNLKIYELVYENSGVLPKGKWKFWKKVWRLWNSSYPQEKYKSPDAIRISYKRICRHLSINAWSLDKIHNVINNKHLSLD